MNTDWSSITWEYSRSTITSKCHHIWSIDGQWTHRTVCGLNIQSTVPKEIIHSSITTGIKCLFPQVLSVQHNQSALNKKAAENLWTERHIYSWSGVWAIRTSCCAARQSAAETLFGLSWVGPCHSPPATGGSRRRSPPERETLKINNWFNIHCKRNTK